jgi:RNA polymerase sigma-70 factor, ECF subfamily
MNTPTATLDLIERFRRGDSEAFTLLFQKYQRRLAVLIHYKLSPERRQPEDVEEVIQETFLAAFEDMGQFEYRAPGSFLHWLSRIADHIITDAARWKNRQKRRVDLTRFRSESNPLGPEPADSKSPSRLLLEQEQLQLLFRRLNALPQQYRQVILLAKIEGLSTQEMTERLGKPRDAVALLLHRAIRRFRELENLNEHS